MQQNCVLCIVPAHSCAVAVVADIVAAAAAGTVVVVAVVTIVGFAKTRLA